MMEEFGCGAPVPRINKVLLLKDVRYLETHLLALMSNQTSAQKYKSGITATERCSHLHRPSLNIKKGWI